MYQLWYGFVHVPKGLINMKHRQYVLSMLFHTVLVTLLLAMVGRAKDCNAPLTPPSQERAVEIDRAAFCENPAVSSIHGAFTLSAKRNHHAKVIDTFIFNGEFDMLEVRLMTMWSEVDRFVLVESDRTFSGRPKPLFFAEQRERYKHFLHKMHYYMFPMPEELPDAWSRETAMRNALLDGAQALREIPLSEGDVVITADIDEVLSPTVLPYLRHCDGFSDDNTICFHTHLSYYSYEFRKKMAWLYPNAIVVDNPSTFPPITAQALRDKPENSCILNSGWHCSYCFGSLPQFVNKLKSFSHTEFSTEQYTNEANIMRNVLEGKDIFNRGVGEDLIRVPLNADNAPPFVLENKDCYIHMVDREEWALQYDQTDL